MGLNSAGNHVDTGLFNSLDQSCNCLIRESVSENHPSNGLLLGHAIASHDVWWKQLSGASRRMSASLSSMSVAGTQLYQDDDVREKDDSEVKQKEEKESLVTADAYERALLKAMHKNTRVSVEKT